jgi:hypothetical protein
MAYEIYSRFIKNITPKYSYVYVGLLGCNAMWICTWTPTFQRNILSPSSGLWGEVASN